MPRTIYGADFKELETFSNPWKVLADLHCSLHLSDMTQDEAYKLFQACVAEVQKRLILNLPNFGVQVVDKDGIRRMKDITVKNLP